MTTPTLHPTSPATDLPILVADDDAGVCLLMEDTLRGEGFNVVSVHTGRQVLDWLAGPWAVRIQIGTSLLIMVVGVFLTVKAWGTLAGLN